MKNLLFSLLALGTLSAYAQETHKLNLECSDGDSFERKFSIDAYDLKLSNVKTVKLKVDTDTCQGDASQRDQNGRIVIGGACDTMKVFNIVESAKIKKQVIQFQDFGHNGQWENSGTLLAKGGNIKATFKQDGTSVFINYSGEILLDPTSLKCDKEESVNCSDEVFKIFKAKKLVFNEITGNSYVEFLDGSSKKMFCETVQ